MAICHGLPGSGLAPYNQLSEATGEGRHVRLIYDGKDLEFMVTGNVHEYDKELLGAIVRAVTMGRDLDYLSCGQTTWKTVIRGLEADLSYDFDPEKVRVAKEALARNSTDPADFPRPDLAIEIDMSPPHVDRQTIYTDLGVAEVWRLVRGRELVIARLQAGRIICASRRKPVPPHPRRGGPSVALRGRPGARSSLESSPESMGDGIGSPGVTDNPSSIPADSTTASPLLITPARSVLRERRLAPKMLRLCLLIMRAFPPVHVEPLRLAHRQAFHQRPRQPIRWRLTDPREDVCAA